MFLEGTMDSIIIIIIIIFGIKLYMFRTVLLSIISSFSLYTQQWLCVIQVCWLLQLSANLYVLLCVQWKTADDGQRNCLKHVEFYSKNQFEKLVHLVGFIIRIHHNAQLPDRQIYILGICVKTLCNCHKTSTQKSAALHSNCATAPTLDHRDDAQSVMWLSVCSGNHMCLENVSYVQLAATVWWG